MKLSTVLAKTTKRPKRRPALETLEERKLLSWVPLDQVLTQGIATAGLLPPLSAMNLYSQNVTHTLTPTGQFPPGAVQVGVNSETGEQVFAVADKYVAQIDVTGLSAAAAADPTQLLHQAQGELLQAKLTNANDAGLASVSIDKYLGAGRFLVTAGTNATLDTLKPELAKLPGFKDAVEDYLFPSEELKTTVPSASQPLPLTAAPDPALSEIGAAGGLVFSGSVSQTIVAGSTISYSVLLNGGQTLAAIVTPDSNLQATLTIADPKGKVLGSATGSAPGALTAVQAITVGKSGTYSVSVGGAGGTAGNFTLQVLVNSQLQNEQFLGGSNDNSLANAQQIDGSPLNLGNGISRSAMYGNIPVQASAGDAFVSERGVGVQLVSSSGVIEATFNNPALQAGTINGMHIGPNGNLYVGVDTSPGNGTGGEIVEMTQTGTVVTTIHLPNDTPTNFFYYPFGFSIASDSTLWVAQPNTGHVVHLDASGNLIKSYSTPSNPEWTAVRSDGQVFISNETGGIIQQLDPGSGKLTTFATDPGGLPFGLSFTSAGDLLVADPIVGVLRFNSSGKLTQTISDFNQPIDVGVDPSGNIVAGTGFGTVDRYTAAGTLIISTSVPGPVIGVSVVGTEGPPPPPADTTDYYSFSLAKGQTMTAVLSDLGKISGNVTLLSPNGTPLALGKVISGSEETINSYLAPAKGTYYLLVTGNGVQYSLVLETDADFTNGTNTSLATAQNLFPGSKGVESVLGALTQISLWGVDWQPTPPQLIHTINTQTGAFTSTFNSPTTPVTNPYGFNMAFDGTNLWYNDGLSFGSNTIFKLNPTTGAVISSFPSPTSSLLTGLAYLNGSLWGVDVNGNVSQINPSTGALVGSFSLPALFPATGIAGDPGRGVLWAVNQFHTLFEIDPVKQTIIKSAPDGLSRNEQDLGFFNNELYVSETLGPGANDIAVFNADTLTETRDLPMNVATFISGLAADGIGLNQSNYYHFTANVKDKLSISATSPYASSAGPFQPANPLVAVLQLYDANGNLLATSTPGGSISYNVTTAGDYYVAISGNNGTTGDYTLSVSGATGALPAFTVTGTTPPANSYNKPISSITVDFNDTILLTSLPGSLPNVTFGGKAATGFQVDNDHEVTYFVQGLPPGQNVPYTFQITAGAVTDIHGVGVNGFSETIVINTIPPHLITNSINEGSILPTGNLTYTCSFQEAIVPSSVSTSSFDLHGVFRNADYGPSSFSFDSTDTILTINYSGLPQDNYTLTLIATGFKDRSGFILDGEPGPPPTLVPSGNGVEGGNFFVDFTLTHGTEALPVNFSSVPPLGDLIYQGSFTDAVVNPPGSTNTYTVNLAANQTLTLDLTSDGNLQGAITVKDPSNNVIGTATASSKGSEVVLQTAPITGLGTYSIVVGGANNTEGLFNIQATLNAAATTGTHGTIGTAQDLTGSFVPLAGTATRGAVLGGINQLVAHTGDAYTSERGGPGVVVVANAGGVLSTLSNPVFSTGVVQAMREGPDGNLYVGLDTAPGLGTGGEILKFSPTGTLVATIHLPNDSPGVGFYYPFGFAVASDSSFWVPQPNTGNIVHVDASGNLIKSYSTGSGSNPEWTAVRSDGQVFISNDQNSQILQLDPGTGNISTFASGFSLPFGLSFTASGNLLVSDVNNGVDVLNTSGTVIQTVFDFGAISSQLDPSGNFMIANADFGSVDKFDPNGNFVTSTTLPGFPIGLAVAGVDGPPPPAAVLDNFYSFHLDAGQSTTIAYNQLGGTGTATVTLKNGSGTVLATAVTGPTNFSQVISNFVAGSTGTYYIDVHGNNINYGLTVTRNAAFDQEPNNTQKTAQPLPTAGGALGAVFVPPGVKVGQSYDGLNFFDTTCGCVPPDPNSAVGPTQVVETTNTAIRIFDKTTGVVDLTSEIGTLFGIPAFSDPYIVYDDIANRFVFVILTTDSQGGDGVALVVSKDSNPLDGWLPAETVNFGSNVLDFPKVGFNADAYVITGNLFGPSDTPLQFVTVDKQQLFNGNFVDYLYQRHPGFPNYFRAEVPAQMHGATPGMPMYLIGENGYGNGSAANVVTLTNELSNNPAFTDTPIPVDPYGFPPPADQPGGAGSVATNDTTFSHADWRMINGHGMLASAQNVSVPDDGFSTSRVRWYEFNTDGTPSLVQQGTINPGPGVDTYYGAPALDKNGDIGITYMQSSLNEFVSMAVAGRLVTDPLGAMSPSTIVAPGTFTDFDFFRTGDYSGMSVDPTDGLTFWATSEYAGSNPVYNTHLASFTTPHNQDQDWYSFAATPGQHFTVTIGVPGSSSGAQFVNKLSPTTSVYDPNGNLVVSGTTFLSFTVPPGGGGTYAVVVAGANNTEGEYILQVTDPPAAPQLGVSLAGTSVAPVQPSGTSGGLSLAAPVLTTSTTTATGAVSIGALDTASSTTAASAPATVTLSGVSQPVSLAVNYGQDGQASANQAAPPADEALVGLGIDTKKNSSSATIASLAKSLLFGNG
jgi:streptogramin lyase